MTRLRRGAVALFVGGFVVLQAIWMVTLPPFEGIDEFDHAYRAAAVARGQLVAEDPAFLGRGILVAVPPDIVEAAHAQCSALRYTGPDNCSAAETLPDGRVLVGSGAATYYPPFYWLAGTVAKPFTGAGALMAMRVTGAVLCALFVGLAAWCTRRRASVWPLVGLTAAMSLTLVYSTIVAAPNGIEMTAALAVWCALLSALDETDPRYVRRYLWVASLSAAAMCSVRPLAPIFVVLTVLTVLALGGRRAVDVVRGQLRTVLAGSVLVVAAAAGMVVWTRVVVADAKAAPGGADDIGLQPLHGVLWMVQSVAAFPYRNQFAPAPVFLLVGAVVLGLFLAVRRYGGARATAVAATSLLVALVLPFVATILAGESREGVIWQGRYGLPYAVGFLLVIGFALATPTDDDQRRARRARVGRVAAVAVAATYALATVIGLVDLRHDELTDNPASVADPAWHVPPIWLVVVLVALAYAAQLAAAIALGRSAGEDAAQSSPSEKADSRS